MLFRKFLVEVFGPGVQHLPLADRATIANMAPEYRATQVSMMMNLFKYMKLTGRSDEHIALVKEYLKQNHMFFDVEKKILIIQMLSNWILSTVEAWLFNKKTSSRFNFLK